MPNHAAPLESESCAWKKTSRVCWHIITGEYPPITGGVSDYTHQVAQSLVSLGQEVHVWVPACIQKRQQTDGSVVIHETDGTFRFKDLRLISKLFKGQQGSRRLLVQYVPHAFGFKGLNVGFCVWLLTQRRSNPWIMFHEVAYPIGVRQSLKHNLLGMVNRLMAFLAMRAASRALVSTSSWKPMLGGRCECLPIPSNIPRIPNQRLTDTVRKKYKVSEHIVGHFGTYGDNIKPLLKKVIQSIYAAIPSVSFLLLGRGAEEFAKETREYLPSAGSIFGVGNLSAPELSAHLSACDVMIQPFLDGVTTRRTSVMAGLAHGLPIVTTSGHLTESFWAHKRAVEMCPLGRPDIFATVVNKLLTDQSARSSLSESALQTYDDCFSIEAHLRKLLKPSV